MDEQTLSHRFADAVLDEPPLGFDPDRVVTEAAGLNHRRRAVLVSGVAVAAALAVAATVVPHVLARDVAPAVPLTQLWPSGDPPQLTFPKPTSPLISRQRAAEAALLAPFRPGGGAALYGPDLGQADPTESDYESGRHAIGYDATTTAYPKDMEIDLEMVTRVLNAPVTPQPMGTWCPPATCTLSALPGGDILAVDHGAFGNIMLPAAGPHRSVLDVRDFRADGTEVEVRLSVSSAQTSMKFPDGASVTVCCGVPYDASKLPTLAQLEALATDPAWDLTP